MTRSIDDVPSLFQHIRRGEPGAALLPALTFYRGRVRARRMTYQELGERVDGLACHLAGSKGIERGDRVGVLARNCPELALLMLATMRVGAAIVPLNPGAPVDEWTSILEHSRARILFASADLLPKVEGPMDKLLLDEAMLQRSGDPPEQPDLGSAPAVVLYTSGTTGRPKGVTLSHANLVANARSMATRFRLERTTQLAVLPLFHAHAFGFGLMSALLTHGHLVFTEQFDALSWAHVVREEHVRVTSVVPTLLAPLLEVKARQEKVPTLECMLVSSAPLRPALARAFEEQTGISLVHGWGLSEFTNFACCLSPDLAAGERRGLLYGGEIASVGGALEGTEVKVVTASGALAREGEEGELCLRGPSRMLAYLDDADATRGVIESDGFLRTGDLGLFRTVGGRAMFFVTGRLKEIIIRGGEKICPLAIERRLIRDVPGLEGRLAVLGFAHATHGEEVGAYIELGELHEALQQKLLSAVGEMTAERRPKVILFGGASIPRTHTGKVQRRKLTPLFAPYEAWKGAPLLAPA